MAKTNLMLTYFPVENGLKEQNLRNEGIIDLKTIIRWREGLTHQKETRDLTWIPTSYVLGNFFPWKILTCVRDDSLNMSLVASPQTYDPHPPKINKKEKECMWQVLRMPC